MQVQQYKIDLLSTFLEYPPSLVIILVQSCKLCIQISVRFRFCMGLAKYCNCSLWPLGVYFTKFTLNPYFLKPAPLGSLYLRTTTNNYYVLYKINSSNSKLKTVTSKSSICTSSVLSPHFQDHVDEQIQKFTIVILNHENLVTSNIINVNLFHTDAK